MKKKKKKKTIQKVRLCRDCFTAHIGKREYCKVCMKIYELERLLSIPKQEYEKMQLEKIIAEKIKSAEKYRKYNYYIYPTF